MERAKRNFDNEREMRAYYKSEGKGTFSYRSYGDDGYSIKFREKE